MTSLNKNSFTEYLFLCFLSIVILCSCNEINVFEKNTVIPDMHWKNNFNVTGTFNITDTVSSYNVYIVLRHTDAYPYNNIWLNAGLQSPGDSIQFQKINLLLGTDAQGWEGTGMNDIWEVRKLISGLPKRFIKKGEYRFSISQIMRDDPLPFVMSVGLRLQKVS